MKIITHQPAPDFRMTDVAGHTIDLAKLRGKKIYLAFERNAGCPVCNLRTHQLLKHADALEENATVILIYESTRERMMEYLGTKDFPFHFVSDPGSRLYQLYAVERSWTKVFSGLFNGIISRAIAGNKLFDKSLSQDGHLNTIPAEFIIDENGKIEVAHYGKFVGDHLPIPFLLSSLNVRPVGV